jgi:hypothetical protein
VAAASCAVLPSFKHDPAASATPPNDGVDRKKERIPLFLSPSSSLIGSCEETNEAKIKLTKREGERERETLSAKPNKAYYQSLEPQALSFSFSFPPFNSLFVNIC